VEHREPGPIAVAERPRPSSVEEQRAERLAEERDRHDRDEDPGGLPQHLDVQHVLHHRPVAQTEALPQRHREERGERHQPESPDLDQAEDHRLAEPRELGARVTDHEPGHAGRRGRGEQGVHEAQRRLPLRTRPRKGPEEDRPGEDDRDEREDEHPREAHAGPGQQPEEADQPDEEEQRQVRLDREDRPRHPPHPEDGPAGEQVHEQDDEDAVRGQVQGAIPEEARPVTGGAPGRDELDEEAEQEEEGGDPADPVAGGGEAVAAVLHDPGHEGQRREHRRRDPSDRSPVRGPLQGSSLPSSGLLLPETVAARAVLVTPGDPLDGTAAG
jgi:hypothetical protein